MIWSENISVSCHDTDINGIVRPSPILRYMQEAANLQLYNLGPSNEHLRENGMAFVLARVGMHIYSPLHSYDKICAQSWACESRLSSFYRCGKILRHDETIAELVSVWALINIKDRHLYRVSEIPMNFKTDEMLYSDISVHVRIPHEIELKQTGERSIGYSDVDINHHMNNTNYPDMLCDFIGDMSGRRVISVSINFLTEAALGETIKISMANNGDIYYFRTHKKSGAVGIEAILELSAAQI
jgi:medium-chain acyl-[acyl-carrier-protein] hydrolase